MASKKQKHWNILAVVSILLAGLLAFSGINQLDVGRVPSRDALRLSSASRALTTDSRRMASSGWSPLRGEKLSDQEAVLDQQGLNEAAHHVQVGIYATSTYDLDLSIPSYSSNGYVWMRWGEDLQRYLSERDQTIEQGVTLVNGLLSDADPVLTPMSSAPVHNEDGSYYQLFSYIGRFYIDKASFRHFPFVTVSLPLVLEMEDVNGALDYPNFRFEPDIQNSGMGLFAGIIGWLNRGWSIAEYRHNYATNFGLGGSADDYSLVIFDISFGTSSWSAFWRLILPLLVVMAMVLLVFKVRADEQDARAGIPVTVLLTLVFLQQTYRDELPDLPYLTFLDQVYVIAYVVTLLAFILVIFIGRRYGELEAMPEGEARDRKQQRLEQLDELWPITVVIFSSISVFGCWITLPPGG
ncbi:hypothetical protein KR52_08125 [Synechococcus sp. KORDI-52]|uniref:hypothetical protein n=1 Tax=Synechococcus sp. KORDI-52 TaxID=585425 RepID=UPI0004E07981|nr:hypothetical protein [Synechococcus sp. KORDI-52]AII49106.1 hypothetical protein KR52_08125 [Synechococcus sp. KORDI-52]